jgi:hypothetical protein
MSVPQKVLDLVALFRRNTSAFHAPQYTEAMVRLEFINPLFKCLGWDMDNEQGHAKAYKDVTHEAAIKIGGASKAPDYCFRIGGVPKFFLEVKKPSDRIRDDPVSAYQLRRYAWTGKLPLSVLTNFEEFAVYDCRLKPAHADKASAARILYLRFEEYPERWEEIAGVFSREAILNDSFNKYASSTKAKRGTASVDAAFLQEIETWQEMLARNLALRNPALNHRELNYAVQATIDRILFLRMCEDRGVEPYGQLQKLAQGVEIYQELLGLYHQAADHYNSGLFHFQMENGRPEKPDTLTLGLMMDDEPLRNILRGLYYPECPYEFSVLSGEILGQVHEQFLGKVIRLTAGRRAVVEDKPGTRKAGGIYYTPAYIVQHVVNQTVGKLLGRPGVSTPACTPQQAARLRILDPACGSGSFLLGAYQFLLDWHCDRYLEDGPAKHPKELYQGPGGLWRLTTAEKKRILLNNIYGVDIDPQAVEVAKLSLLLKVLEGESEQTLQQQRRLFHERALPDLSGNVQCGNALIGPDFYDQQTGLFGEEERYRINVFDWDAAFPEIMKAGGFDVVIGNPPWGQKAVSNEEVVKRYLGERYPSARGIYDLFRPFVEQGIRLLRRGGMFGMVLPDIVLLKDYLETRRLLLTELTLEAITWWGMAFASAVIDATTIIGSKRPAPADHSVRTWVRDKVSCAQEIPQADFWADPRLTFNLYLTPAKRKVLQELSTFPRLGNYFEVHEGVHSGNMRKELFVNAQLDETCRELYFGRGEIQPYHLRWEGRYVRLAVLPEKKTRQRYANLGRPEWHEREKVLVRRTGDHVLAAVDRRGRYASNNFFVLFPRRPCALSLDGLCAILNSRFMTWYFRTIEPRRGRVFAELKIKHLIAFPLPPATLDSPGCEALNQAAADRARLAAKLAWALSPHEIAALEREAAYLDAAIDTWVQELFGLSHDL